MVTDTTVEVIKSAVLEAENEPVLLKIKSNGSEFSFYYALGDSGWELLADKVDASYLSTARAGGFTGTTIGMYASEKKFEFNQ